MLSDNQQTDLAGLTASEDDHGSCAPTEIDNICDLLKDSGPSLEETVKEELDRFFGLLRDACRDSRLSNAVRMKILKLIELRAMGWELDDDAADVGGQKLGGAESSESRNVTTRQVSRSRPRRATAPAVPPPPAPPQPGEPPRSLGSLDRSVNDFFWRLPKDKMAVANCDHGNGNPIFKNLVMQNSSHAEKAKTAAKTPADVNSQCTVSLAQEIWDETSDALGSSHDFQKPLFVPSCSGDDSNIFEYTSTVTVGRDSIRITGANAVLVGTAARAVKDHFSDLLKNSDNEVAASVQTPACNNEVAMNVPAAACKELRTVLEHIKLPNTCNEPGQRTETALQKVAVPKHTGSHRSVVNQLRTAFGNARPQMDDVHPPPGEQSSMTPAAEMLCKEKNRCVVGGYGEPYAMRMSVLAGKDDLQRADELRPLQNQGSIWTAEPNMSLLNHTATMQCFETMLPCKQDAKKTASNALKHVPWPNTTKSLPAQSGLETLHDVSAPAATKEHKTARSSQELSSFPMQVPSSTIHTLEPAEKLKRALQSLMAQASFETLHNGASTKTMAFKTPGTSEELSSLVDNEVPFSAILTQKLSTWSDDSRSLPVQTSYKILDHVSEPFSTEEYKTTKSSQELSSSLNQDSPVLSKAFDTMTATDALNHASQHDATNGLPVQTGFKMPDHASALVWTNRCKTIESSQELSSSLNQDSQVLSKAVDTMTATDALNHASQHDATNSLPVQTGFKMPDHDSALLWTNRCKTIESLQELSSSLDQADQEPPAPDSSPCGMQSKHKCYTRDFLLQCGRSSLAAKMPIDFPQLDPTVANVMVKAHRSMSDSKAKN
ncbi:hypothetical protein V5799_024178 [Amblyomma americanum]|uniref:Uncharacterized protein n=1 Tax=Amblyomma americanum TaxID=6943 RepID=A0AAQ4ECS1_AMBAM